LETFRALRRMLTGETGLESGASGGFRPAEPSAAQNGTVIQTCRQCGAAHGAEATSCYVCRALLSPNGQGRGVRSEGFARTHDALAVAPDWRGEVSHRLQEYRKRQRRLREGPSQPALAFDEETSAGDDKPVRSRAAYAAAAVAAAPPMSRRVHRVHRTERVEINLLQPSLDFSGATASAAGWHVALVSPMASLHERRLAAALDAALLLFAYGSFLTLFAALGGRLAASKVDAAVLLATLGLFYAQYFALFTFFGGVTPGMMWRGLRLATFDGREPRVRDKAWRTFGYLVSAGTLMIGFLWALWDEDHLCWHDRISHTHLSWTADASRGPGMDTELASEAEGPQFASARLDIRAEGDPARRGDSRY
jgi:uncharacterized RDD family membrane protein YckC/ribosomal protein L40E